MECGEAVYAEKLRGLLKRARRIGRKRPRLADATLKTCVRRLDADLNAILKPPPRCDTGALEPTNNGSERSIRPCLTFRKITGGFRAEKGAKLYAAIRSTLETARRRAITPLKAIRLTLSRPTTAKMA